MTAQFLIAFVSSALFSLVLTPLVIHLAVRVGAMDHPGGRKVHAKPIPRLGGVAIYVSFFLALILVLNLSPSIETTTWITGREGLMFVASLLVVLALGIWDDLHALKPSQKFLVQVFLATIAYIAGFKITIVTHPIDPGAFDLGMLSYPATVLWIVGITNAVNLIDGLDGLASGVATIAALTIFAVSFLGNELGSALVALLLAGALVGFLPYNFNPARIFLGDSGSLFLGFTLAIVSMQGGTRASTAFALIVPILALGFPIMDTLLAMIRRFIRSFLPEAAEQSLSQKMKSMFTADRGHIHHKLISKGMSQKDAVLLLYVISLIFGLSALGITIVNNRIAAIILLAIGVVTIFGIRKLRYTEMSPLRSGVFLSLYDRPIFNREAFAFFLDFGFVLFSCAASYVMITGSLSLDKPFFVTVALLSAPQLAIFWITGLHRRTIAHFGIGDGIAITKIVVGSVLFSAAVLIGLNLLLLKASTAFNPTVLLLDLYLLLTLVVGSRISFRVLKYLFQRDADHGRRAIIYGANANGMLILQRFLDSPDDDMAPLGFLDNNPQLEGKHLNGYPIFGSHWKIPYLVRKESVQEIIVCDGTLTAEVLKRLRRFSIDHRLKVTRPHILLEDITHPQHAEGTPADVPQEPEAARFAVFSLRKK